MILHWDTNTKREQSKTHREHFHTHLSSSLNCHQSIATNDSIPSWKKLRNTAIFVVPRHLIQYPPRMIYNKIRSTRTPRNSSSAVNQNTPLTRGHQTSPTPDEWVIVSIPKIIADNCTTVHRTHVHALPRQLSQITLKVIFPAYSPIPTALVLSSSGKMTSQCSIDVMKNRG